MKIRVVYLKPGAQTDRELELPPRSTIRHAIEKSGLLGEFPELNLATHFIGIFGKKASLNRVLSEYDRVEIYRPLQLDPKQARLLRAERNKAPVVKRLKRRRLVLADKI